MSACPAFAGEGGATISAALRGVDCMTGQATSYAFGRLFGEDGRLLPALTLLMTIYVALFAMGLLTGRTRIGLSSLTPRMLTLGLVLTFATSWVAYQNVVWTLATGAPDQIASIVTGTRGSATTAFADRLDQVFNAVQAIADQASRPAPPTETGITPATPMVGGFTAATVLWLSALMLLLGTVGVLVTAKIALAAMLALGPVFIVLALFPGTRGLFEGWLKAVVLFAIVPLLGVLIGGGAVVALDPVVRSISLEGAQPSTRGVAVLFLGATVYLALMLMAVKTAATLVSGWRLPGTRGGSAGQVTSAAETSAASGRAEQRLFAEQTSMVSGGDHRVRSMVAALPAPSVEGPGVRRIAASVRPPSAEIIQIDGGGRRTPSRDQRALGLGSRFRAHPERPSREHVA